MSPGSRSAGRLALPSPEGRGWTATALFPAVAGRVRGFFRAPGQSSQWKEQQVKRQMAKGKKQK